MNRKLFIGIDLEPHVKKILDKNVSGWRHLPIRLHAKENYHIPLVQLGWVDEDLIPDISDIVRETCNDTAVFDLAFERIAPAYRGGEEGDIRDAHGIWVKGAISDELKNFHGDLLDALEIMHPEHKNFAPHIVLGQMRKEKWQELEQFPDLTKEFPLTMDIMTITLFEQAVIEDKRVFEPLDVFELS